MMGGATLVVLAWEQRASSFAVCLVQDRLDRLQCLPIVSRLCCLARLRLVLSRLGQQSAIVTDQRSASQP
jgi:hypothetical protein